jgi:hypothetical protein
MDVTFTKLGGRRYGIAVTRERGPELAPRRGPGYHDYVPHDVAHFLVEAEARLSGGVFGRIAAGRNNVFWPADPAVKRHQARREAKRPPTAAERADMARSEGLASYCVPLWELRERRICELPPWAVETEREHAGLRESPLVARVLARMDDFGARWHALPEGGAITLAWPG